MKDRCGTPPVRDTDALERRVAVLEAFCEVLRARLLERCGFDFEEEPAPARDERAPSDLGEASLA